MLPAVIVGLMLVSLTCGENPAVQVILTNKGLQYGKHVGAGWIQEKLESVTFPDISGKLRIGILGNVHYTLTGARITKCDFPEPSVEFYQSATGFKTSVSGLSVALTGEWRAHYGPIHSGGTFNMAVFNVAVTSVVKLGNDTNRHLSVSSVHCDAGVGGVNIQFHGGSSWIIEKVVDHYKGRIAGDIRDGICPKVQESIAILEQHLQAMNVSFNVNQVVTLDLPLTGLPVVDASSLNLGLKGEFYSIKAPAEPPFQAKPFTVPEQPGRMLSVGLSEFTLNSASFGYFSAGVLQAVINDSMIPKFSPVHLNTSSMGPYVPQLPKMFPGLLVSLQVYAREVPLFSFLPGAVCLDLKGAVKAFAIQPNGTQTPLFKLNVDSLFSGKVWIADGRLKGSMKLNNLTVTLVSSEVGTVKTDAIQNILLKVSSIAMAKVNQILGKGVSLPRMKQAELVNTVLELDKGFIAVSSDAQVLMSD
ncbi:bactericidal permeability-increasing protein [Sparus aurata]|uniref:Bactericidal permeability-increasing protein n=1 Tax=Sparus aurata TaxID=8175 RepID=A0A671VJD1_SPAAU|nr:bactericidal permeability-increasing protein-like [Sparus aurata]